MKSLVRLKLRHTIDSTVLLIPIVPRHPLRRGPPAREREKERDSETTMKTGPEAARLLMWLEGE